MHRYGLLALAALLPGCGPSDASEAEPAPAVTPSPSPSAGASAPAPLPSPSAQITVALDAEGLRFVAADTGRTSLLPFGVPREQVEQAVQRATSGSPERSVGEECPAGPTQFTRFGELQLAFQDGLWIGWALDGANPHTTIDGIGIGTTRREAEASRTVTMIPESTLDHEFVLGSPEQETAIGGTFGAPGQGGRIQYLWAGVACNFR